MKSDKEIAQMHRLLEDGWSKRRIAAWLGISRNTVERYLGLGDAQSLQAGNRKNKLAHCLEWLAKQGEECIEDSEALRRMLEEERKIKVSRRTMQRALKLLGEKKGQGNAAVILRKVEETSTSHAAEVALAAASWRIGPYLLISSGELSLGDSRIEMAGAQKQLLLIFASKPNQLIEQEEIAAQLWPGERRNKDRTKAIRLSVHRLRQVFASGPLGGEIIRSVYGKGYVFHALVENVAPVSPMPADMRWEEPEKPGRHAFKLFGEMMMGNQFYAEVHDYWPNRDPYRLHRQESLLQQSVRHDPLFEQAHLELCYVQLLQCFWGMRSAQDVLPTLQKQISTLDQLQLQPAGWLGIKAEVQSLLLWQPLITQRLYGTWLAATLPRGMPLFSWTRHLIFTGKPRTAIQLLETNVRENLCQGWMSLGMAYFAIGNLGAALEAIQKQLQIEPSMVGTRLFLALLLAKRGQADLATRLVLDTGLLDRPFQGVQALAACTLAQGALTQRAHELLDEAMGKINKDPSKAGAIGYWGLAALELKRPGDAIKLLKLSIQHRCYSAPVLFSTPFLKPYANTPACRLFAEKMRKAFPILV
jgi:DNA-binding winged helix-turn-helix (wHTH) protein/transposase